LVLLLDERVKGDVCGSGVEDVEITEVAEKARITKVAEKAGITEVAEMAKMAKMTEGVQGI
jgi:hypothetical protein